MPVVLRYLFVVSSNIRVFQIYLNVSLVFRNLLQLHVLCLLFHVLCLLFVFSPCSRGSFVNVPLTIFCPAGHRPDRQPRILRGGRVEARSFSVKIHVCHSQLIAGYPCHHLAARSRFHREKRCGSPVIIPILYYGLLLYHKYHCTDNITYLPFTSINSSQVHRIIIRKQNLVPRLVNP